MDFKLEELIELSKKFDQTTLGQFIRAITPAVAANSKLIELGLDALQNKRSELPAKMLSPQEIADELSVSTKTLANYRRRWDWFRPEYGRGKGQRYSSNLIAKVIEAKKAESEIC